MKLFTITVVVLMIATSYGQISPDPTSSGLEPGKNESFRNSFFLD